MHEKKLKRGCWPCPSQPLNGLFTSPELSLKNLADYFFFTSHTILMDYQLTEIAKHIENKRGGGIFTKYPLKSHKWKPYFCWPPIHAPNSFGLALILSRNHHGYLCGQWYVCAAIIIDTRVTNGALQSPWILVWQTSGISAAITITITMGTCVTSGISVIQSPWILVWPVVSVWFNHHGYWCDQWYQCDSITMNTSVTSGISVIQSPWILVWPVVHCKHRGYLRDQWYQWAEITMDTVWPIYLYTSISIDILVSSGITWTHHGDSIHVDFSTQ